MSFQYKKKVSNYKKINNKYMYFCMSSEDYFLLKEEKDTFVYLQVDNQVILLLYSIIFEFVFNSFFIYIYFIYIIIINFSF
jgi:hypothetical protein